MKKLAITASTVALTVGSAHATEYNVMVFSVIAPKGTVAVPRKIAKLPCCLEAVASGSCRGTNRPSKFSDYSLHLYGTR